MEIQDTERRKKSVRRPLIKEDEKLLDIHDVADLLNLNIQTVKGYVRKGRIPYIKISAGCLRFEKQSISKWLADRTVTAYKVTMSLIKKGA